MIRYQELHHPFDAQIFCFLIKRMPANGLDSLNVYGSMDEAHVVFSKKRRSPCLPHFQLAQYNETSEQSAQLLV